MQQSKCHRYRCRILSTAFGMLSGGKKKKPPAKINVVVFFRRQYVN